MSPYEIDVLLHYYAQCDDHPDMQRRPPVWEQTMRAFLAADLIEPDLHASHSRTHKLTERGNAYVDALQRVPLPVQVWVMPDVAEQVAQERRQPTSLRVFA